MVFEIPWILDLSPSGTYTYQKLVPTGEEKPHNVIPLPKGMENAKTSPIFTNKDS